MQANVGILLTVFICLCLSGRVCRALFGLSGLPFRWFCFQFVTNVLCNKVLIFELIVNISHDIHLLAVCFSAVVI